MKKLNQNGQALVEYVLIIGIVTAIAFGMIKMFGGHLKDSITKTSCELVGETYQKGKNPGEGTCK